MVQIYALLAVLFEDCGGGGGSGDRVPETSTNSTENSIMTMLQGIRKGRRNKYLRGQKMFRIDRGRLLAQYSTSGRPGDCAKVSSSTGLLWIEYQYLPKWTAVASSPILVVYIKQ